GPHAGTPARRVERAKALVALNRAEEAERELEAVAQAPEAGSLAATAALWRGDLLLGARNDEGLRLIRQARASGLLDRADQEYAAALLATRGDEAIDHLGKVLAEEPAHFRANHTCAALLLWLGRAREARQRLTVARAFYPRDPQLYLL